MIHADFLCHLPLNQASLVAQLLKNPPTLQETLAQFLDQEVPWRRYRLPTPVFLGFPGGSDGEESTSNAGDLGSIPELGRSPWGEHGNPLQYSCLENPHGQRSLVGCSSWGSKESEITERLSTPQHPLNQGWGSEDIWEIYVSLASPAGTIPNWQLLPSPQVPSWLSGGWSVLL